MGAIDLDMNRAHAYYMCGACRARIVWLAGKCIWAGTSFHVYEAVRI